MAVKINNQGSTHSIAEIVWICDLADLFNRELATKSVISANYSDCSHTWTIDLQVRDNQYQLELDPENIDPTDVDGFIAEIKLLNG